MEEAMGASRDGFVAVDAARADDADGRLVRLHIVCLVVRGVRAEDDVLRHIVGTGLDEEGVLHVASRMVGGEVQLGEHVQVVVDLRTFGQRESHALEDVDDLVLHDGQRVACAQLDGVGRTREVEVVGFLGSVLQLLLQGVDVVEGELLQFVDLHADGLLVLGCHIAEVLHQRINLTLAAEVFQTQLFNLFCIRCGQGAHFFEKCFDFL